MALLISPNVYQASSHYPTSLIMQDPCLHQYSFEQSLAKCPSECLMYNFTQPPIPHSETQHTLLFIRSQFGSLQTSDWGRIPFYQGSSLRPLLLPVSFGAPVHPVWPLSIRPRDQLMIPALRREFRQNLPATFTHNIQSKITLPVCSRYMRTLCFFK